MAKKSKSENDLTSTDDASKDVPSYDELIFPTIKALNALGGSGTIEEIVNKVIGLENISQTAATAMHLNHSMTALEYRLAWARTYLKRVGAVDNSTRGIWTVTEVGKNYTQDDCAKVPGEVRKQDKLAREAKNATKSENDSEADENGNGVLDWKEELLSALRKITPDAFERLSQRLLREAGFTKVEVKGKSGDGGIDGIGILRVNLVSFTILFQCKRYKGSVSAGAVRDFRGAMQGRCDKGLIVTTGTFTADAKNEATRDGAPAIDLIDGESLCDLLKQLRLGVEVKAVESVIINSKWFESI